MKKILLDTNAYTAFMTGDEAVLEALAEAETTLLSAIVIGELHAGFRGGTRLRENKAQLTSFQQKSTIHILEVTAETAEVFGQLKYELKKAGTPIPLNDVWLAAQAIETGAVIVTYDAHFGKVKGIRLWDALAS
jgi:tRNA(fMet)-specific endonuclease VapC